MMSLINSIKEVGVSGLLDVAFLSILIYVVMLWFKQTRAAFVLTGIVIVAVLYLVMRQFHLTMTALLFEKFFGVILIAIVVIFQEELRTLFEQIAVWSMNRGVRRQKTPHLSREEVEILVKTLADLAKDRIGALVVIRGKDMMLRHLTGGLSLDGRLSEHLLKSIFDPHSMGHDGAVVIESGRVTKFATHLPLSKNIKGVGKGGTRHAAALGLSELCDAMCLVVSEERGTVSAARQGKIAVIENPLKLTQMLEVFYQDVYPPRDIKRWEEIFMKNTREKIIAIVLAMGLWFVNVHSSTITYQRFTVPVTAIEPPKPWTISEIDPKKIDVTFHGPRWAFYTVTKEDIKLVVKPKIEENTQKVRVYAESVTYPGGMILDNYDPVYVAVTLKKNEEKKKVDSSTPSLVEKITEKAKEILPMDNSKEDQNYSSNITAAK
jgi:diadenylate cyclase